MMLYSATVKEKYWFVGRIFTPQMKEKADFCNIYVFVFKIRMSRYKNRSNIRSWFCMCSLLRLNWILDFQRTVPHNFVSN